MAELLFNVGRQEVTVRHRAPVNQWFEVSWFALQENFQCDPSVNVQIETIDPFHRRPMVSTEFAGDPVTAVTQRSGTFKGRFHSYSSDYLTLVDENNQLQRIERMHIIAISLPDAKFKEAQKRRVRILLPNPGPADVQFNYILPSHAIKLKNNYKLIVGDKGVMMTFNAQLRNDAMVEEIEVENVFVYEQQNDISKLVADQQQQYEKSRRQLYDTLNKKQNTYNESRAAMMSAPPQMNDDDGDQDSTQFGRSQRVVKVPWKKTTLVHSRTYSNATQIAENITETSVFVNRSSSIPTVSTGSFESCDHVVLLKRAELGDTDRPSGTIDLVYYNSKQPVRAPEKRTAILDFWQQSTEHLFLRFGPSPTIVLRRDLVSNIPQMARSEQIITVRVVIANYNDEKRTVLCQERMGDIVRNVGGALTAKNYYTLENSEVSRRGMQTIYQEVEQISAEFGQGSALINGWKDQTDSDSFEMDAKHQPLWLTDAVSNDDPLYIDVKLHNIPSAAGGTPGIGLFLYRFTHKMRR